MGQSWNYDELAASLEDLGESEVRRRMDASVYGPPRSDKRLFVEKWLRDRDAAAAAVSRAEDIELARRATKAAEDANVIAWIALIVAVLGAVTAIAALLH